MIPADIRLLDPLFRAEVTTGSANYRFEIWVVIRKTPKGFWIMHLGTDFALLRTDGKKPRDETLSEHYRSYDDDARKEAADRDYENYVRSPGVWSREVKWLKADTSFVHATKEEALESLAHRKCTHAYHAFRRYQDALASMDAVCKAAGIDALDVEKEYQRRQLSRREMIFVPFD